MFPFIPVPDQEFLKLLPLRELIDRGYLPLACGLREVGEFFGVTPQLLTDFRHSAAFRSDPGALAAWLRVGELEARQVVCRRYNRERFLAALKDIRSQTRATAQEFVPRMIHECAAAGVAVVIVPEFKGCCVSGASKWLTPAKAMIQLSLRYKRDDQFFFSFFHEAGHLLKTEGGRMKDEKHSSAEICPGSNCSRQSAEQESEAAADAFARDLLIPPEDARELPGLLTPEAVEAFAQRLGIAAGIVVGRLHHEGLLPWHEMANLKRTIDVSWIREGQEAMCATWLTVTQAAELLLHDLPQLEDGRGWGRGQGRARARISEAAGRGAFITNCRKGPARRIEPVSLAAWRLRQRDRDLDAEDAEGIAEKEAA